VEPAYRKHHTLQSRQSVEERWNLRLDTDAKSSDGETVNPRDLLATPVDSSRCRPQLSGQAFEECALASPVRPDQASKLAYVDRQRDSVDSNDAAETHGQIIGGQ
jgi:hypothetical protein